MKIFDDERLCEECKGVGWYWDEDDWQRPCETCGGNGKVKRNDQKDLADYIERTDVVAG